MKNVLLLLTTTADGGLDKASLEGLTAAKELAGRLGGEFKAGLVGENLQPAADLLAGAGATLVMGVAGEAYSVSRYGTDTPAFAAIVKAAGADLIVVPGTMRMSRCAPGVAQRSGAAIDTHISAVEVVDGVVKVKRWYYRQRMEAVLSRASGPWLILLSTGVFAPYAGAPAAGAVVEAVAVDGGSSRTVVLGIEEAASGAQTIKPEAEVLFVAGAGWPKKQADGQSHVADAERLILGFLDKAKASLGSTKSLVDQSGEGAVLSFMTHMNQVGQTGSTPRHAKGLATCCHGEEPHVVGWRFVNQRRAINLDPSCGWAQGKADVLYVADAFALMEKVNALL